MRDRLKNNLSYLLKLVISIGLLFWLFKKVDIDKLIINFKNIDYFWIILSLILYISTNFFASWRWKIILKAFNINIKYFKLLKLYWIGNFFNNFLPSVIGGDAIKILKIIKYSKKGNKLNASVSILIDRILGLWALLLLGLIIVIIDYQKLANNLSKIIIFLNVIFIISILMLLYKKSYKVLNYMLRVFKLNKYSEYFNRIHEALNFFRQQKYVIFKTLFLSFIIQFIAVISNIYICYSIDVILPLNIYYIIFPIIFIVLMIPISINGIGLRESAYVILFSKYNITNEKALAISFLSFFLYIIMSSLGGLFYIIDKDIDN